MAAAVGISLTFTSTSSKANSRLATSSHFFLLGNKCNFLFLNLFLIFHSYKSVVKNKKESEQLNDVLRSPIC